MVLKKELRELFIRDGMDLLKRAEGLLDHIASKKVADLSVTQVESFFHLIHSLKGTAAMVEGGETLVELLHSLESELACRPAQDSAQNMGWLQNASKVMNQSRAFFEAFESGVTPEMSVESDSDRGILGQGVFQGSERLIWFPMSALRQVFTPQELAGRDVVCLNGIWAPVVGVPTPSCLGLAVSLNSGSQGHCILAVREILGVYSWEDAASRGALNSIEIIAPKSKEKAAAA